MSEEIKRYSCNGGYAEMLEDKTGDFIALDDYWQLETKLAITIDALESIRDGNPSSIPYNTAYEALTKIKGESA